MKNWKTLLKNRKFFIRYFESFWKLLLRRGSAPRILTRRPLYKPYASDLDPQKNSCGRYWYWSFFKKLIFILTIINSYQFSTLLLCPWTFKFSPNSAKITSKMTHVSSEPMCRRCLWLQYLFDTKFQEWFY